MTLAKDVPIGVYKGAFGNSPYFPPGVPHVGVQAINSYEQFIGRKVNYVLEYMADAPTTWAQFETAVLARSGTAISPNVAADWAPQLAGRTLVLATPALAGLSIGTGGTTWAQEASGVNDAHWTALGNSIFNAGLTTVVWRIAREFNGAGFYPWQVATTTTSDFITAWRRIVGILRGICPTWKFQWNPTQGSSALTEVTYAYPGDAYVDDVGVDIYDSGYTNLTATPYVRLLADQQAAWDRFATQNNGIQAWQAFTLAHSKTLSFPEWGLRGYTTGSPPVYSGGGDNAYFVSQMAATFASTPNIGWHAPWGNPSDYVDQPNFATPQSKAALLASFFAYPVRAFTSSRGHWTFALAEPNGGPVIAELPNARGRQFVARLDDSFQASCTINGRSLQAGLVTETATDLLATRNGTNLFRGRIAPSSDDLDAARHTTALQALDYRDLLSRRILYEADQLMFTQVNDVAIAWALIGTTQRRSGLGITQGNIPAVAVLRDRLFTAGDVIGEQLATLADLDGGYDWEISPALQFNAWRGRGDPSGTKLLDFGGNLIKATRTLDPGNYANMVRLGGGTATLQRMYAGSADPNAAPGSLTGVGNTYRYQVAAITPEGETPASNIFWGVVVAGKSSLGISWPVFPRATGYNVYGRNPTFGPSTLTGTPQGLNPAFQAISGGEHRYAVSATLADGETQTTEVTVTVPSGGATSVRLAWDAFPNATAFRIYGRNPSHLQYFGQIAGTQYNWTDSGSGTTDPISGVYPFNAPFTPQRIASNIQGTFWTDTGAAAPNGPLPSGIPANLVAYAFAADITSTKAGRWEKSIGDTDLLYQPTVDQRVQVELANAATLAGTYDVTFAPDAWSPDVLWIGDIPRLLIRSGRLDVDTTSLRCTQIQVDIGDDGTETVTATLGVKLLDIYQRVRRVYSRLNKIDRR